MKLDVGFHSIEERRVFMKPPAQLTKAQRQKRKAWLEEHAAVTGKEWCCPERLNKSERVGTPQKFAELLISIAGSRDGHVREMQRELEMRRQVVPKRWSAHA
jgi:hypothetical protein